MSLETLAKLRYQYVTQQKELKGKRAVELSKCELSRYLFASQFVSFGGAKETITEEMKERVEILFDLYEFKFNEHQSCMGVVIKYLREESEPDEYNSFDELLFNYGCKHCNESRNLKRQIGELGTKIGQINGRITMIGKRLS